MTTKHRPSFIGRDPAYTGPPPALRPAAQRADDPAPPLAVPPVEKTAEPSGPAAAKPRQPRPRGPSRSGQDAPRAPAFDGACRLNVHVRLGERATAHLETLAQSSGESPEQLLRYLRHDLVADLRALLATDARAAYATPPRVGASVRIQLTLHGEDYRRARQWLDPLGIGDHVLRGRLQGVLTSLLQDRIDTLAGGRGRQDRSES